MSDRRRVLVVGADGADPHIAARLMAADRLPHLARLCAQGGWGPLATTFPPVSPVAWTTCLTGVPPALHGIRDFITKARDSYLPTIGLFKVSAGADGLPAYSGLRTVPTLGEILTEAGRMAYLLKVPGTFPPVPVRGGMLAGFGMPDLLGTFGVSAWYTTDKAGKVEGAPEGAELVHSLTPAGTGAWRGQVSGPGSAALGFTVHREGGRVGIWFDAGLSIPPLSIGEWSGWARLAFDVPGRGAVPGLCRFRLIGLSEPLELYRTPVHCAPEQPFYPLSEPTGFAAHLQDLVGPFATLGMPADMDGVRRGIVDLDTFLGDAYANWEQQVDMTLRLMSTAGNSRAPSWDLLVTHLFTLDNVQHLFWHCQDLTHPGYSAEREARYGGEIERAYRWLDARLGTMIDRAGPDTAVIVVSDHGGLPVRRLIHVNAWLRSLGYLWPRETVPDGTAARIDWDRTRVAMYGTGGIWLNLQGREPRGIVPPGAPYEALRREIADALSAWRDPEVGQLIVKEVLRGEDVFGPAAQETGPDLMVALWPGYGLGRGEGLGRVMCGTPLVISNLTPWSGGHEGPHLPSDVPGICALSEPLAGRLSQGMASLEDIAPTVLRLLGLDPAPGMTGRSLV